MFKIHLVNCKEGEMEETLEVSLFLFISNFFISLKPSDFRRGEEHSFILKPATSMWKDLKVLGERSSQLSKPQFGNYASNLGVASKNADGWKIASTDDQYAVMVSCRCNYTGSLAFPVVSYVIEGC